MLVFSFLIFQIFAETDQHCGKYGEVEQQDVPLFNKREWFSSFSLVFNYWAIDSLCVPWEFWSLEAKKGEKKMKENISLSFARFKHEA